MQRNPLIDANGILESLMIPFFELELVALSLSMVPGS